VDISTLFGVATTKVQGDLEVIEKALLTGVIEPWCALNFGDSSLAPMRRYLMPDADAERDRENFSKRAQSFHDLVKRYRDNGFDIDDATIRELAVRFDVPVPALPEEAKRAPSIALAPTDIARVVKVNEARASAGVGQLTKTVDGQPVLDPDGDLTVVAFAAKNEAASAPAAAPPKPTNGASTTPPS
jgi:hypothetical protein